LGSLRIFAITPSENPRWPTNEKVRAPYRFRQGINWPAVAVVAVEAGDKVAATMLAAAGEEKPGCLACAAGVVHAVGVRLPARMAWLPANNPLLQATERMLPG
jgi:hypothetical protein